MASRIHKGDKVEKLTWNTIGEFLEEQKFIEKTAILKGKFGMKEDINKELRTLDERFEKWKKTLEFMGQEAKASSKRVEDKGCHKIIPRAALSQAVSIRLYVLPSGEVQIQKNTIDVRVKNTKTNKYI